LLCRYENIIIFAAQFFLKYEDLLRVACEAIPLKVPGENSFAFLPLFIFKKINKHV
jgi:hypothetical protein